NDCSPSAGDDPILAKDEIIFHGQVIFAVVAETRDAARHAVRLARIEIAPEPPAITIEDALDQATDDVLPPYEFHRGDVAKALAAAPLKLEGSVRAGGQEHFYLEGQVALATPEEDGGMTLYS